MSWEQDTTKLESCPCGRGHVLEIEHYPDNSWSRPWAELQLDCDICRREWVIRSDRLYRIADDRVCDSARKATAAAEGLYIQAARAAIDYIIANSAVSRPRDEHTILTGARLCHDGPIVYKRHRDAGASPGDRCQPLGNLDWIAERLSDSSIRKTLAAAERDYRRAKARQTATEELNTGRGIARRSRLR